MTAEELEKYSSAITLSDMEIFVFPELMYALVLANIMSPVIWQWRDEDCFRKLQGKSPYKKLMRLKQYIMDKYEFNLDLETWGLTDKATELKRFEKLISEADIAKSNALFGYEGDKYYFDVDIRRHFGLDKYDSDIIPYWKTETVEAMNAFRLKSGYNGAAGECVSLAALYAAAAFIVCGIPLEDIYMVLTPLHSQNFIDIQDGVLTNNRRITTRAMWFNGTAISNKAQRALRNERVTTVAHCSGHIHCMYDEATIDPQAYRYFLGRLGGFLSAGLTGLVFANFLRSHPEYQQYFQFCTEHRGERKFVKAEVLFHYEHGSNFRIADHTFEKLLAEVSSEDYMPYKHIERMCCEQLDTFVRYEKIDVREEAGREKLKKYLGPFVPEADRLVEQLYDFTHIEAKTPSVERNYVDSGPIRISTEQNREDIIEYLQGIRESNSTADLAFYAYRDMGRCDWAPFVKAAIERNPVSIEAVKDMPVERVYDWLRNMANSSIYDGKRLAQPDEVANYKTGDGIEKAILLANVIHNNRPGQRIEIVIDGSNVLVAADGDYRFTSGKQLKTRLVVAE